MNGPNFALRVQSAFGYILCTRQVPAEETAGILTLGDKGFENEGC